jgi:hypothetical protein
MFSYANRALAKPLLGILLLSGKLGPSPPCLTSPRDSGVNKIVSSFMSNGLISLFRDLQGLIHRDTEDTDTLQSNQPWADSSHDALLGVIYNTIDKLDH